MAPKPNQDIPKTFEDRVKIDIDNIKTVADLKNQKTKVKEYDLTYFQEGKLMRREIGHYGRTDFIQDAFTLEKWTIYDDLVSRLKMSAHEIDMIPKDSQGGLTWDPDSPGYFEQPLRCKHPGCKNFPMWKCDGQQSYLRNVTYDRVWQGCNGLVCEAHVVKYFDKTDENLENTFWDQKEYFYDYERCKIGDGVDRAEFEKCNLGSCCNWPCGGCGGSGGSGGCGGCGDCCGGCCRCDMKCGSCDPCAIPKRLCEKCLGACGACVGTCLVLLWLCCFCCPKKKQSLDPIEPIPVTLMRPV